MAEAVNDDTRQALISAARQIQARAYVPYSNYPVGAAILGADGIIYTGVNVENASYGLTNCAERTAVFKMVTAGCRELKAVAVCGGPGVTPCGACRQVLAEFVAQEAPVFLCEPSGDARQTTLSALLPDHFGPSHLYRPHGA